MSFNYFNSDSGDQFKVQPSEGSNLRTTATAIASARKRRATASPDAPTLEAPPTRDLQGEAQARVPGALLASALSILMNPRRAAGTLASYLKGASAGADASYQNKLADNQRTNAAAMTQFGANQQKFGDDLRLDAADSQDEQSALSEKWRGKEFDRRGDQILYGRGRDLVGDARWKTGHEFQVSQAGLAEQWKKTNWERTKALDERSDALKGLDAYMKFGKYAAGFDAPSQKPINTGAAPFTQKIGFQPFTDPLKAAPKPADPYKMGMLNLQIEKLKQLKVWQLGKLNEGQQRNENSGANAGLRAQELVLRQQAERFKQEMEAARLSGIEPEKALALSIQAGQLSANRRLSPEDKATFQQMSRNLKSLAGGDLPASQNSAPSVSPYTLPSPSGGATSSFRGVTPPAPTVGVRPTPTNPAPQSGYRPPSRKLTATPTVNPSAQAGNRGGFTPKKPTLRSSEKKRLTSGF